MRPSFTNPKLNNLVMNRYLPFIPLLFLHAAAPAHGAIVASGVQNLAIPETFIPGIYVNVLTNATSGSLPSDFDTAPWIGFDLGGIDISNGDALRPVISGSSRVINLPATSSVGSPSNLPVGANFSELHTGPAPDQFQLLTVGYVGFGFSPTVGAPVQYGWAKITANNAGPGTIHEWAYESVPGTSIQVGAVPEPAGAGFVLLALGGFWLRRSR